MVNKQKLNNRKTEAVISEEGSIKWFVVSIQVDRLLIWPKKNLLKGLNGGVWKTNEFLIMYEKAKMVREIRSWCGHFSGEKLWVQWKYMIITSKCICLKVIKNFFSLLLNKKLLSYQLFYHKLFWGSRLSCGWLLTTRLTPLTKDHIGGMYIYKYLKKKQDFG